MIRKWKTYKNIIEIIYRRQFKHTPSLASFPFQLFIFFIFQKKKIIYEKLRYEHTTYQKSHV